MEVSPSAGGTGQWTLSWTSEQTTEIGTYAISPTNPVAAATPLRWSLKAEVSGEGLYTLIGGQLSMRDPTTPGITTSASTTPAVTVGGNTIDVTVTAGQSAGVSSFNSRAGDIEPEAADYSAFYDELGAASAAQAAAEAASIPAAATGAAPGSYTSPNVTVNEYGQITEISDGSGGGGSLPSSYHMPIPALRSLRTRPSSWTTTCLPRTRSASTGRQDGLAEHHHQRYDGGRQHDHH